MHLKKRFFISAAALTIFTPSVPSQPETPTIEIECTTHNPGYHSPSPASPNGHLALPPNGLAAPTEKYLNAKKSIESLDVPSEQNLSEKKLLAILEWKESLLKIERELSKLFKKYQSTLEAIHFICKNLPLENEILTNRLAQTKEALYRHMSLREKWSQKMKYPKPESIFVEIRIDITNGMTKKIERLEETLKDLIRLIKTIELCQKTLHSLNNNEKYLKYFFENFLKNTATIGEIKPPKCVATFFGPRRTNYKKVKDKIKDKIKNNKKIWEKAKQYERELKKWMDDLKKIYELPGDDFFRQMEQ